MSIIITDKMVKVNEKWTEKRKQAQETAKKMKQAGYFKRGLRMMLCGTQLETYICPKCGEVKVKKANLCRDRFCPVCKWRLSLQRYSQMCKIMNWLNENEKKIGTFKFGFLTLTIKNCKCSELSETLKLMNNAWDRCCKRKTFKENVSGWARSTEITYNQRSNTVHPHFHCIMLFERELTNNYINELRKEFTKMWKERLGVTYTPIVDFRKVVNMHPSNEFTNVEKAALETFKYAVKDSETNEMPLNSFRRVVEGLQSKRLVSFGGVLKLAKTETQAEMEEVKEDTEDITIQCTCGESIKEALLKWSFDENNFRLYTLEKGKIEVETDKKEIENELKRYLEYERK